MKNKTAIVTGGGKGIGRAVCLALAKNGVNLVINYASSESAAAQTAKECIEMGVLAVTVKADVSKPDDCKLLADTAIKEFGSIDILVNNAGITRDNLLMRMPLEDFDAVIDINLKGAFNMTKAVTRTMMKQRSGRIINMSSVVGLLGNAGQTNYCASKAGLIGMTKAFAKEIASRNVTVNAIAPGFIISDMTDSLSDEIKDKMKEQIPLSDFGTGADIAAAVVFLASEGARYITGQTLSVDGGMSMR